MAAKAGVLGRPGGEGVEHLAGDDGGPRQHDVAACGDERHARYAAGIAERPGAPTSSVMTTPS